jgi:hypothetical protein
MRMSMNPDLGIFAPLKLPMRMNPKIFCFLDFLAINQLKFFYKQHNSTKLDQGYRLMYKLSCLISKNYSTFFLYQSIILIFHSLTNSLTYLLTGSYYFQKGRYFSVLISTKKIFDFLLRIFLSYIPSQVRIEHDLPLPMILMGEKLAKLCQVTVMT